MFQCTDCWKSLLGTLHSFMTWKTLPLVVAPPHSPSQGGTEGGGGGGDGGHTCYKALMCLHLGEGRGFSWEQEFGKIMIYAVCCCSMEKCWKFNLNRGQILGNLFRTFSVTFLCTSPCPPQRSQVCQSCTPPVRVELHLLFRDTLGWGGHCQGGPRVPARDSMVPRLWRRVQPPPLSFQ